MSGKGAVPEELQVLAGEYVLGVLDAAEMRAVRRRAMADPNFAAAISGWEARLAPMADALPPLPPPAALWARIEQAIAPLPDETLDEAPPLPAAPAPVAAPRPPPPRPVPLTPQVEPPLVPRVRAATAAAPRRPRLWPWQLTTAASMALAAGIAALALVPTLQERLGIPPGIIGLPTTPAPVRVAALMPPDSHTPGFLAEAQPNGTVMLTALSTVTVPAGHDLELWVLPPGATKPASLGVLPPVGRQITLAKAPQDGTQLMVSVEPPGGSPSGLPTGPVVYAGTFGQRSL